MFTIIPSDESLEQTRNPSSTLPSSPGEFREQEWYTGELELESVPRPIPCKICITVGQPLPYGERLFYETGDTVIRLRDFGEKHRILVLGVIGSFTPYCWNRHLYQVMSKSRYYAERGIDYICCIATNDAFTQTAWAAHLGCENTVVMLSDTTRRFTKALGMDTVIPWLDNTVRSKRYIIYAENMIVSKMICAPNDGPDVKWHCEHLQSQEFLGEAEQESDVDSWF